MTSKPSRVISKPPSDDEIIQWWSHAKKRSLLSLLTPSFVRKLFRMLLSLVFAIPKYPLDEPQDKKEFSNLLKYAEAHQLQDNTIYSPIGMGVYQGEAVVFRKWELGGSHPQWMVYKLQDQNPNEIPENASQSFLCLASILEQYKKQPSLWKNYLQKKVGVELVKLYPEQIQCGYTLSLMKDARNNLAIDNKTQLLKKQQQQKTKQSLKCLKCPYFQRLHKRRKSIGQ